MLAFMIMAYSTGVLDFIWLPPLNGLWCLTIYNWLAAVLNKQITVLVADFPDNTLAERASVSLSGRNSTSREKKTQTYKVPRVSL